MPSLAPCRFTSIVGMRVVTARVIIVVTGSAVIDTDRDDKPRQVSTILPINIILVIKAAFVSFAAFFTYNNMMSIHVSFSKQGVDF